MAALPTLDVRRLGHANHVLADYPAARHLWADVLGGEVFSEWEQASAGTRNALLAAAGTCVELFSPTTPESAMAGWIRRQGEGWHSIEWTLPDLDEAIEVVAAHGIRITEHAPGAYAFTHPKDGHGICLELTSAHFPDDPRDREGGQGPGPHGPLGLLGLDCVRVSAPDAEVAASWLTGLTGVEVAEERIVGHLAGRALRVPLGGHTVELVEPSADGELATFVERRGARIYSLVFAVADAGVARAVLADVGVAVLPSPGDVVRLDPSATSGATIELIER